MAFLRDLIRPMGLAAPGLLWHAHRHTLRAACGKEAATVPGRFASRLSEITDSFKAITAPKPQQAVALDCLHHLASLGIHDRPSCVEQIQTLREVPQRSSAQQDRLEQLTQRCCITAHRRVTP